MRTSKLTRPSESNLSNLKSTEEPAKSKSSRTVKMNDEGEAAGGAFKAATVAHSAKSAESKDGDLRQESQDELKLKKKKPVKKRKLNSKPGKIHIRLPSIEAYQKDLCFAAEAPGRVVVRLERLMGSDKIRPVDGKYMQTLIERLEEEETVAWQKKIKLRKKAEKDRHRQLAISGLMEPGPGMEDLYNHPVFRVNRILNRLTSLDSSFSRNMATKLPPIVQINPFEKDDTGEFFKDYPFHRALRKSWECYKSSREEKKTVEKVESVPEEIISYTERTRNSIRDSFRISILPKLPLFTSPPQSTANIPSSKATALPADLEEEDEYDEELEAEHQPPPSVAASETEMEESEAEELTEMEQVTNELNKEYAETLSALMGKYGVPEDTNEFENEWKPFNSELVETFIKDFETADDMLEAARDVFDVFTRQAIVVEDHVKATSVQSKAKNKNTTSGKKKQDMTVPELTSATQSQLLEESEAASNEESEAASQEVSTTPSGSKMAARAAPLEQDDEGEETQEVNSGGQATNDGEGAEDENAENSQAEGANETSEPIPVETDEEEEEEPEG